MANFVIVCWWLNADYVYKIDQNGNSVDQLSQSQPNSFVSILF